MLMSHLKYVSLRMLLMHRLLMQRHRVHLFGLHLTLRNDFLKNIVLISRMKISNLHLILTHSKLIMSLVQQQPGMVWIYIFRSINMIKWKKKMKMENHSITRTKQKDNMIIRNQSLKISVFMRNHQKKSKWKFKKIQWAI